MELIQTWSKPLTRQISRVLGSGEQVCWRGATFQVAMLSLKDKRGFMSQEAVVPVVLTSPLTTGRGYSSMTMLGGDLIVSGGYDGQDYLSSVEMWNGSKWVELDDKRLEIGRAFHAAVSIKAGVLSCV